MKKFLLIIFLFTYTAVTYSQSKYIKYSSLIDSLQVTKSCRLSLEKHYNSGNNLYLEEVSNLKISLDDLSNRIGYSLDNGDYYHYTNHIYSDVDRDLTDEDIFPFYKGRYLRGVGLFTFVAAIYISYDSKSSRQFGDYLIRFKIKSDAKVVTYNDLQKVDWNKIESRFNSVFSQCSVLDLEPLILEDSGVDLVWYMKAGPDKDRWFQLLNFRSVKRAQFTQKPSRLRKLLNKY